MLVVRYISPENRGRMFAVNHQCMGTIQVNVDVTWERHLIIKHINRKTGKALYAMEAGVLHTCILPPPVHTLRDLIKYFWLIP